MGSQGSDERATIGRTMRNGQTLPITLANGDVIEIEHHGDRCRWGVRVPAGAVVGVPEWRDSRNSDDAED
jgi:hypothetical protein